MLKESFTSSLTIILIWNNIFNIVATVLLSIVFNITFDAEAAIAATIAVIVSTFLIIVFGEIIPKNIAFRHAEKLSITTVYAMLFFKYITYPLVFIVSLVTRKKSRKVTEVELIEVLDSSESEGVFEHHEKELVKAAVDMKEKIVGDSMVPWDRVHYLSIQPTRHELVQILKNKYHFSRLPVLNQKKDRLLGFIKMKDVYAYLILNNKNPVFNDDKVDLTNLLLTPLFVKEEDSLLDVMGLLQQKKLHMAVVTTTGIKQEKKQNYNRLTGILTLEDVLEELIGEIYDEHDEIKYNEPVVKIGLDSFLIKGDVDFSTVFNNYLDDVEKPSGDYKTFHGWVAHQSNMQKINSSFHWSYQNLEIHVHKITKKYVLYKVIEHMPKNEEIDKLIDN